MTTSAATTIDSAELSQLVDLPASPRVLDVRPNTGGLTLFGAGFYLACTRCPLRRLTARSRVGALAP
jgi:hypothetical protein